MRIEDFYNVAKGSKSVLNLTDIIDEEFSFDYDGIHHTIKYTKEYGDCFIHRKHPNGIGWHEYGLYELIELLK